MHQLVSLFQLILAAYAMLQLSGELEGPVLVQKISKISVQKQGKHNN